MTVTEQDHVIICPNCSGDGWIGGIACAVCDRRGFLVIDQEKTKTIAPRIAPRRKPESVS